MTTANQHLQSKSKTIPIQDVKVIAVTGGKGGVGKTSVSFNTAIALAKAGKKVLILDADFGLANIDVMFGTRARKNLSHVVSGQCTLAEVLLPGPYGIQVIPSASGMLSMTSLSQQQQVGLIHAFSDLQDTYDVLLIDTAAGISNQVLNFSYASQHVVLVVCDDPSSITDAYALMKLLKNRYQVSHFKLVVNMIRDLSSGVDVYLRIKKVAELFLDVVIELVATVPFDENLRQAIRCQKPVVDMFPSTPSCFAFNNLAKQVNSWPTPHHRAGHITFFMERLMSHQSHFDEGLYCD
jgi:flagellar biosynthesis protein FlhG